MEFDARLPPITEERALQLAKLYDKAEKDIQQAILKAIARGNKLDYLLAMKKNVRKIIEELNKGSRKWCDEAIPHLYQAGINFADKDVEDIKKLAKEHGVEVDFPKPKASGGYGAIHQQAVSVLAENVYTKFQDIHALIGRRVNDIYRTLGLEIARGPIVGYQTYNQAARRLREELLERGITAFTDRAGKQWRLKTYAEMVAIQTTAEAHWRGTENRLMERGGDLVKISTHNNPCGKCGPWEGRVVSLTGKTKGYPSMADAIAGGFRHVRCRHAFGLYVPELHGEETGGGFDIPPSLTSPKMNPVSTDQALAKMWEAHHPVAKALTPEERKAVNRYRENGYKKINADLRAGKKLTPQGKLLVDLTQRAKTPVDLTVHRVVYGNIPFDTDNLVGAIFEERGFMSTSLRPDIADHLMLNKTSSRQALMHINVPKGTPASFLEAYARPYMDKAPSMEGLGQEFEVLFPPGQKMLVTRMEEKDGVSHVYMDLLQGG